MSKCAIIEDMKDSYDFLKNTIYFKFLPQELNLSILPIILGFERCHPNKGLIGPLTKSHHILHFVLSGRGFYTLEGQTFNVSEGDLFLIPPECRISYRPDPEDPWQYMWLEFSGSECKNLCEQAMLTPKTPLYHPQSEEIFRHMADMIEESITSSESGVTINCAGHMLCIFGQLIRERNFSSEHVLSRGEAKIQPVLEYIERNLGDESLSVEQVARQMNFSVPYLSRIFKAFMGLSPTKYIIERRMRKACAMLESKAFTVSEIAAAVGYNSPFYFSNEFKKRVGITPSQYHAQAKE